MKKQKSLVKEINGYNFYEEVRNARKPVIVYCYALPAIKHFKYQHLIEDLAYIYGSKIKFLKIDMLKVHYDENYSVKHLPCLMFVKKGDLMDTINGAQSWEKLVTAVERFLVWQPESKPEIPCKVTTLKDYYHIKLERIRWDEEWERIKEKERLTAENENQKKKLIIPADLSILDENFPLLV